METHEEKFVPISDIFGNARLFSTKGRPVDERSTLVQFFADEVGKPVKQIAVRLGHYKHLSDLYALKSQYSDRLRRPCFVCLKNGRTAACEHSKETARKYFWYITRTSVMARVDEQVGEAVRRLGER